MRSAVPVLARRHVGEEQQRVRVQLRPSSAAVRSVSMTASTPRIAPVPSAATTGMPPPLQTTIIWRPPRARAG